MIVSWMLYTSTSRIAAECRQHEIADIVDHAVVRNAVDGITGAFIATPIHFAQYIEGSDVAVQQLLDRLLRDPRHQDLRIADQGLYGERRFPKWGMAYVGSSIFVQRALERLIDPELFAKSDAVANVLSLMQAFAAPYYRLQRQEG